jgi:drug/metabolite transporter (DMT)-like permease
VVNCSLEYTNQENAMSKPALREMLYPIVQALLAAALFGASAPLAKLLLGQVEPIPLAALLYLGSGCGALLFGLLRRVGNTGTGEAHLGRKDGPWLAGAVLAGGVAAPIALLFGLRTTPAATAALLLNFEGVATALIAVVAFREASGRRIWAAIVAITVASALLSWSPGSAWGVSLGALGILGACVLWGVDNNLTRSISAKDPLTIVTIKGFGAGLFSLALAFALGQPWPAPGVIAGALALGSISYGLSIVLFILALRGMGAARTGALFGIAPFIGTLLALVLFREPLNWLFLAALPLMIGGAVLLLGENHAHAHAHAPLEHEHRHSHDDLHHEHALGECPPGACHSHPHRHDAYAHSHAHKPDLHHHHDHDRESDIA